MGLVHLEKQVSFGGGAFKELTPSIRAPWNELVLCLLSTNCTNCTYNLLIAYSSEVHFLIESYSVLVWCLTVVYASV